MFSGVGGIKMTAREDITEWLNEGKKMKDITHMIVACDTFSYDDYPVYVCASEDVGKIFKKYDGPNMQKVMEVYSYNKDLGEQLQEHRAFHFN
tara:strand:- start:52 stop:330 length:279 start_codon:yes stop_codon:yes gene_type:complete